MTDTIRIGNCSGYYGDRLAAVREMLEGGPLDYLTGDYLAELTMLILGRDRMKDAGLGYAKTFVRQMADNLALAQEKGVKIVTNAGGLNPAGLAAQLREIVTSLRLDLTIAHVEGDDLRERADEFDFGQVLTANAYLGAFGIAEALNRGADVVVTGRVTDASVVVGPAIAHFGWGREDYDELAGAVAAGHIIECGTQATGGNFSGFTQLDDVSWPGFPLAEIDGDGSFVITKHEGTGGAVTVDTVTAQLMYEVTGHDYLGPDVTTRLDTLTLTQDGPDRVRVTGVTGSAPPPDLKVCLNEFGGFRNQIEFLLTGLDLDAKAELIRGQVDAALAQNPPDVVEWTLARTDRDDPSTQALGTASLRVDAKAADPEKVGRTFSDAAIQVALASYPGFYVMRPPAKGTPFGTYRPAFVAQDRVPHVVVLESGERIEIPAPANADDRVGPGGTSRERSEWGRNEDRIEITDGLDTDSASAPPYSTDNGGDWSDTVRAPLGRLVHARSGDKGGDANVGVWTDAAHPRREEAFAWLREHLDVAAVRRLLPETRDLDVELHEFDNLSAINIVIRGILGDGVAASTRLDPQAKALGEWLRAREVEIPHHLLPSAERDVRHHFPLENGAERHAQRRGDDQRKGEQS